MFSDLEAVPEVEHSAPSRFHVYPTLLWISIIGVCTSTVVVDLGFPGSLARGFVDLGFAGSGPSRETSLVRYH